MTAQVEIDTGHRADVLAVPHEAVVYEQNRKVCYMPREDHLERGEVKVGQETTEWIEITEGLPKGRKSPSIHRFGRATPNPSPASMTRHPGHRSISPRNSPPPAVGGSRRGSGRQGGRTAQGPSQSRRSGSQESQAGCICRRRPRPNDGSDRRVPPRSGDGLCVIIVLQ